MPIAKVQMPDGRIAKFEVPDGTTESEVTDFASHMSQSQKSDDYSWGEAGIIGAGRTLDRIGKGMQQGYYALTGNDSAQEELKNRAAIEDGLYKKLQDEHPIATAVGESLSSMVTPAGAGLKTMMAAGAIPGLIEYGTAGERAGRGVVGALGAGAGYGIGKTISRINKPFTAVDDPVRNEFVQTFRDNNIPMSAANETGNRSLKWIDSALDNLPWVSDKQYVVKQAQQDAFNKAVSRTFGEDSPNLTSDVLNSAKRNIGDKFDDLSSRNRLNFTNQQLNEITQLKFDMDRYAPGDTKRIVTNYIDDLLGKVEPDGTISGRAYRELDSKLGKKMRGSSDGDLRSYLGDVRDIVRGAMDDSIGVDDQAAWREARKQYANLQIVADAVKASPTGDVSAAGLLQRVNNSSKSAKFTGVGELGKLAKAGKEIMTPLPDSGTAQRAYWMRLMGEGGLGLGALGGLLSPVTALGMAGSAAVPLGVQNALWGGAGNKYLKQGLLNVSPEVERYLMKIGSGAGVAVSKLSTRE